MDQRDAPRGRRIVPLLLACLLLGIAPACVTTSAAPALGPEAPIDVERIYDAESVASEAAPAASPPASVTPAASPPASIPPAASADAPAPSPAPSTAPSPSAPASGGPSTQPVRGVVPHAFDRTLRRRLTRIVNKAHRHGSVPGLQVAVRLPGGQTWTVLAGDAQISPERPVTRDTVFAIASVTKTFVAALILQLVDEGRLKLDAKLSRYLPDTPVSDEVTIRELLSHRSGIYNYFESPLYNRTVFDEPDHAWTYEEVLGLLKKPYCKPGRCYHYSNTNYVILGRLAEKVTGKPLSELLRERFLDPLGLTHTFYQPDEATPADAAHGYWAFGGRFIDHTKDQEVIPTLSTASVAGPAGAMVSTASDLATWAAALYGGDVLSARSMADMLHTLPPASYGLGTFRQVFLGHTAYGHRGGIRGFGSSMFYFPKDDLAVAIVANRGLWLTDPLFLRVMRAILGKPPHKARNAQAPPASGAPRTEPSTVPGALASGAPGGPVPDQDLAAAP